MKVLGLTNREWVVYGIGASINGAILGAMFHNAGICALNAVFLGVDLVLLPYVNAPEEN